ncbi:MAG: carboxypeptidase regulatory-like domain-containing protein [Brevundimonas sp.]|uniref:carboxypeptidase-like regulatory domain-containing protein n=1 Tax=Brevundimonas sp. TaxID=1871086 RepID=UPI0012048A73|nr:carboxypeptidase-like regulatory domain-containing protein [Brevundimonas sp.]RZJ18792.1 MAG: carboxypeptidase regulatory-like domain-containing protein [Brevundimonas sp.]
MSPRILILALAAFVCAMVVTAVHGKASAYQSVRAGYVTGRVLDEAGRPVAGAQITAQYGQSTYYVSYSRSARTDANGRYSIHVADRLGTWTVYAKARVSTANGSMMMDLTPNDDAPFAGNVGAVRNFSVKFTEQTEDNAYGTGAMVLVTSAIGDYTDLAEVELTLRPVAGGETITRRLRNTGEGYVVTGLRPQIYEITARHNGRPMMVSQPLTPRQDYQWGASYRANFERTGPGIYQLRVDVKAR